MSVLNRIEQELREIEANKRSVTTALRFTKAEIEKLETTAEQQSTCKAEIIRIALAGLYKEIQEANAKRQNNITELDIDF